MGTGFPTGKLLTARSAYPDRNNAIGFFNPLDDNQISVLLINIRHAFRVSEPTNHATITTELMLPIFVPRNTTSPALAKECRRCR
jgi:hypothetical protein